MPFIDVRSQARRRSAAELIEQLRTFRLDLKFSCGIWCFSPAPTRFHDLYRPRVPIETRLETAGRLKEHGLAGLEAHYPNEINEDNLQLWRDFCSSTGIRLVTVVPLLFWDKQFEWGSLSSPVPEARRTAIDLTIRALRLNRELETDFCVIWPGIDGYENPFGIDFAAMRDRFCDGLAEALDQVPGARIAFEPKPYEPRGRIIFGSTAEGLLLGHQVEARLKDPGHRRRLEEGHALCGLNPEIGHALMGYEDLPYAFSLALAEGRLFHMHLNSQPLGNYDQDLNVGAVSPEQTEALLYILKMHGYRGWFGIDVNPVRMPVETAVRINIDALRSANDRINDLDHESIVRAAYDPGRHPGWIESYLVRCRAAHGDRLPPLEPLHP